MAQPSLPVLSALPFMNLRVTSPRMTPLPPIFRLIYSVHRFQEQNTTSTPGNHSQHQNATIAGTIPSAASRHSCVPFSRPHIHTLVQSSRSPTPSSCPASH
uniref:Uncharacterized protein n=1 Tax=Opuntia streptacantha TaxID=393608 RepID=A0A7C9D045_OPUST